MEKPVRKIRRISSLGEEKNRLILKAAEKEFEKYGFGGARMRRIADLAGVPKANVHYYFRSKLDLYNAVLEGIVDLWNQTFESLSANDNPETVLTHFVRKKVEFTRLYPEATRIFTSELIHGAPYLNRRLNKKMSQWTRDRAEVIEQWVAMGKIKPIDPYHLIFMIWASTQHFAQAEAQITSVYGIHKLNRKDYDFQAESLSIMVMRICGLY